MTTISASILLHKTESRSRELLFNVRNSHRNITEFNHLNRQLVPGDTVSIVSKNMLYLFCRDNIEMIHITGNGLSATPTLVENVIGLFTLPFAASILITIPSTSTVTLPRKIEAVYS